MILAVINIYKPGKYINYINKNLKILNKLNINTFISINDCKNYVNKFASEKIVIKENNKNAMPAYGFNKGIEFGLANDYDFCYFIDQDSLISELTIKTLMKEEEKHNFSFLASNVVDESNGESLRYFRGNLNNSMTFHSIRPEHYVKNPKINAAGYTGIFLNLKFIKKHNLMIDESYKIELDDYDFTYRLSKKLPGYLINDSKITHPNKKDSRNNWIGEVIDAYIQLFFLNRKNREYLHIRNYRTLIIKYGKGPFKVLKSSLMRSSGLNNILRVLKEIKG